MENKQSSGSDSVDNQVVVGDLSCKEISLFLTVFVGAFRSIGAETQDKGYYAGLLMGYRLLAQATMALESSDDQGKVRTTAMAISQAISAAMSQSDPAEVGRLINTGLTCINSIHDKIGDQLGNTHLIYKAYMDDDGQLKIKVEGIATEELSESLKNNEEVKNKIENIIKLTKPKSNPENN